jgi:hypothetical protein
MFFICESFLSVSFSHPPYGGRLESEWLGRGTARPAEKQERQRDADPGEHERRLAVEIRDRAEIHRSPALRTTFGSAAPRRACALRLDGVVAAAECRDDQLGDPRAGELLLGE